MNTKTSKRKRDLKTKLMAAVAMLLVSSLMMVTSTYAWFTLSTAPEVTGITTAVGANGNLEMALLPANGLTTSESDYGIKSDAGDSQKIPLLRNITWGNLVDVSDTASYGLNNITLYPSKLNVDQTGKIDAKPLATPQYGADGRVSTVEANTITGAFDTARGQFIENANGVENAKGVRAIGESSSMTARQLAYRTAVGNATSYQGQAQSAAKISLSSRGTALASIAIKHALGNDGAGYTDEELDVLRAAVTDLQTAFGHLENAIKNLIIADSIAPSTVTDDTYKAIVDGITAGSLDSAATNYVGNVTGAVVSATVTNMINTLKTATNNVDTAVDELSALSAGASWNDISGALNRILNTDSMEVNGMTMEEILAGEVKDDQGNVTTPSGKDKLVDAIIDADFKANLVMNSGAGAYSDIADFAGQYSAATEIVVSYGPIQDKALPATMVAEPTAEGTPYLGTYVVATFTASSGTETVNPISEFYGFIIDLAFRTNAADSYLQLQVEGVDRVYSDSTTNQNTQGGGATMSFATPSATFQPYQVQNLMRNIRVVFFNPETNEIIGYARLDMDKASTGADNVTITAPLMLTDATGNPKANDESTATRNESIEIMALTQNTAHLMSVMVYLDGESMTNADVAADAAKSMVGSMNLQFSSSANLKPMEYSDLRAENGGMTDQVLTIPGVTAPAGYRASSAYYLNNQMVFTLSGTTADDTVKVSIDEGAEIEATYGTFNGLTGWVVSVPTDTTVTATSKVAITVVAANQPDTSEPDESEPVTPTATPINSEVTIEGGTATVGSKSFIGDEVTIELTALSGGEITNVTVGGTDADNIEYDSDTGKLTFTSTNIAADSEITIFITTNP